MKYVVFFNGSCEIDAANQEEAEQKFWDLIGNDQPLPDNLYDLDDCKTVEQEREEVNEQYEKMKALWYNPRKEI